MSKKFYFISGLPRSGNTLLSTILSQNPDIGSVGQSCTTDIFTSINLVEQTPRFLSWKDEKGLSNIYSSIFQTYYSHWDKKYVIERSDWIVESNFRFLETYCPNKPKIVILVRDVLEIIKSFLYLAKNYPRFFINQEASNFLKIRPESLTDKNRIETIMRPDGYVVQLLKSIQGFVKSNNQYIIVEYNDLVLNTEDTINSIYDFYDIPRFKHNYKHLNQLSSNGIQYNDYVYGGPLHYINSEKVELSNKQVFLDEETIRKYSGLEVWKK